MLNFYKSLTHLLLVSGLFLMTIPSGMAQSGWTKKKNEVFTKLGYSQFSSDQYFNLSGNDMTTAEFSQKAVSLYGEYGITDRLTAIVDFPFLKIHGFETTENITGIGDLKLGLKYAISQKIPVSLSIVPEIPIAKADNFAQNKINDFEQINLPTGDGEFNIYNTIAASHSFYPIPVYVNAYATFNFRTSYNDIDLSHQVMEGFEIGWQPIKKTWIKGGLKLQQSLSENDQPVSFVRGEGTTYTQWITGIYYGINDNWGVDLSVIGFMGGPQERRNLYNAAAYGLGIVYEIKR